MGLVNLPSVDDIQQQKDPKQQMEMLINTLGLLMKELGEINGYINSKNVKEITASKISAGTIDTGEITIGADASGKFYRIDGGGIVANNGTVNTLLFDLATGLMTLTSVLVQSAVGYPKVELNSITNLIAAISAPGVYAGFLPNGFGAVPSLVFVASNTTKAYMQRATVGGTTIGTFDSEQMNLSSSGNLLAQANGNATVNATGNVNLVPTGSFQVNGNSGVSGTFYVSATSGGSPTIPITFHKGIRTG